MKIVRLALGDLRWTTIPVGFAGENDCTQVQIDCAQEFAEFPTAIPSLTIKSPRRGEGPYPGIVERDGDLVIWTVSGSDLMNSGTGEIQLSFIVDNVIEKSYVAKIRIHRSLLPGEEIPDPIDDWITRANAVLGAIPQTISESVDAALEEAKESGEFDGKDGDPGLDGFSPAASVSKTGNKTTIVITDKDGTTSEEILDGAPGEPGYTPQRGADYWTEADQQAMREDIASDTAAARQAIAGDKSAALGAIESAGSTQAGNVNAAGTTQVGNVNAAGETQVGNVNAAGAAQVAAVEEKGEEVLDSIPSDYSELSGEVSQLKNEIGSMNTATVADLGKALIAKEVEDGKVTEWEFGEAGGGMSATAANLLLTILDEGVYGTDQSENIELLRKALLDIEPVSISAVLDSTPYVGLYYSDLKFIVTATFDDASTLVVDDYRVTTPGQVTSGSNTVTVRFRFTTCETTFTASTATTYSITNTLSNVDTDNNDYLILAGERYEATLTVEEGYYLSSCTVTMGGVDITSTAFINNAVIIAEVTGNVVITVTAAELTYLDDLIVNGGWTLIRDYSDDATTLVKSFAYYGKTASSEYPAMSDCTIEWELKNISESSASLTYVGFGTLDCVTDNYIPINDTIDISYFESANNTSGSLDPGASISGELEVKAGCLIIFQAHGDDFDKFEIKMRGNFVKNTFSEYTEYNLNKLLDTYGNYRTISFYSDNETTLINSGTTDKFKKITDQIDPGTYDVYYKKKVEPAVIGPVWSATRGSFLFGAVSTNTDTVSNYAGGSALSAYGNLWHHSQFTVQNSGMTVIGFQQYIGDMDGENIDGILMIKKVVTE